MALRLLSFSIAFGIGFLSLSERAAVCHAAPSPDDRPLRHELGLAIYSGAASPTLLPDLVRFKNLSLSRHAMTAMAGSYRVLRVPGLVALDGEAHVARHWTFGSENLAEPAWSVGGASILRWLKTPWSHWLRHGSVGFGVGLSYATQPPLFEVETLELTNRLLFHLVMEFEFGLDRLFDDLDVFFRIHHRSGAFGLFNSVVGGSDYLCLGLRISMDGLVAGGKNGN